MIDQSNQLSSFLSSAASSFDKRYEMYIQYDINSASKTEEVRETTNRSEAS